MSIKLQLPTYDGLRGPVQATQFISAMDSLFKANTITDDERQAAFALSAFVPNSPAALWLANSQLETPKDFEKWDSVKEQIKLEFCRPMTLAQNQMEKKKLQMVADEPANAFINRVRFYHHTRDFALPEQQKKEQMYKDLFDRKVKETFIDGLPASLLQKLAAVDLNTSTNAEIVAHALQAQALHLPASTSTAATPVNAVSFRGRGGRFNQRGRGAPRGNRGRGFSNRGGGFQRRPGPSAAELAARPLRTCGKCRQRVKHKDHECFVDLLPNGQPVRPFRRPVNSTEDNDAATSFPFHDPLNGYTG